MDPRSRKIAWTTVCVLFVSSVLAACGGVSLPGGIAGGVLSLIVGAFLLAGAAGTQTGCDGSLQVCLSPLPPRDVGVGPCLSDLGIGADADAGFSQPDAEPLDAALLDTGVEADVGPCLSDVGMGPCLSLDGGPDPRADARADAEVGPCLSPPLDAGPDPRTDAEVGPCLSMAPPDATAEAARMGPCLSMAPPDARVGPCLSPDTGMTGTHDSGAGEDPDSGVDDVSMAPPLESVPEVELVADARIEVLERLAKRGVLPPDVVARLRGDDPEA